MSKYYDPFMHSAEHLLNQTMVRIFNCQRCFSAHINKKKSKCDYYFDRPLTQEETKQIQAQVNEVIEQELPVTIDFISRNEAKNKVNIERVPDKEGLEKLRIVSMGNYDACPCIGPHVSSTNEIGHFKITTTGFENNVLRIRFKLDRPK
ncbi:MAG: hypothetical protein GY729_11280 [Desulfobacteraceae bacterium]|nr:hypothetical protein [Desulfobacteraceae bacterium]